jgi:hypothetical protein
MVGKPEFPLPGPGLGPPPAVAQTGRRVQIRSGRQSGKPRFAEMIGKMMASDRTVMGSRRCLYENDDILVVHSVNDYPDGTREAVLMACTVKDGRIRRVETGATPIPK